MFFLFCLAFIKKVVHFQRRETVGKTLEFYSEITNDVLDTKKHISRVLLCNIVIINLTMMNGRKGDNFNFFIMLIIYFSVLKNLGLTMALTSLLKIEDLF